MIRAFPSPPQIAIHISNMGPGLFSEVLNLLKENKARWHNASSTWRLSLARFEAIKNKLEDLDTLEVDTEAIENSLAMPEEMEVKSGRVVPDFSLLKFPPIKGKAPFENYQKQDILAGLTRNRYGYFIGMGGGKTYIMSALIAHYLLKEKAVNRVMIVTTNIGVRNLYHELTHFIRGIESKDIEIADKSNRAPFYKDNPARILLMSYNGWRLVCNHYKKALKISSSKPRKPFVPIEEWLGGAQGILHLDESHSVAYHTSQQGYLMALHASAFKYRYLYSGTPADKPEKLYNQLKILDPALTHNLAYTDWLDKYANIGTRFSAYDVSSWKHDKLEELNKRFTSKYGVYRKTEEILDLPPHYEKRIYVSMSLPHRKIYEAFVSNTIEQDNQQGRGTTRDVISRFSFMMLAVDNPELLNKHVDKFDNKLVTNLGKFQDSHMKKLEAVDDILQDHEGEKGVLWVAHPVTAETLRKRYESKNPIVVTGETPQEERNALITLFQTDPKHKILIANITVLNTSVNIVQATWQCYVERIWAYAPYEQSTKRIYRIGQTQPVTTYILIYQSSLDVLLDKNLSSKGQLVDKLLAKGFLSPHEWRQIFNYEDDSDDFDFEIPDESEIQLI